MSTERDALSRIALLMNMPPDTAPDAIADAIEGFGLVQSHFCTLGFLVATEMARLATGRDLLNSLCRDRRLMERVSDLLADHARHHLLLREGPTQEHFRTLLVAIRKIAKES